MHVLVAGGAGYVGSKLIPALLNKGHKVTVLDLYMYGDDLFEKHPNLREVKGDIRDIELVRSSLEGCDSVIHLACISNDPSFELNPDLGKSINLDSFDPFVQAAKETGIKRFIYASSSSVYGVKDAPNVTEDMELEPLTDYSKFKAECERILFSHMNDDFICTVLRPATVCGYAPRQRLDVVVNILTNLAYHKGKIKVMGGSQMRPNIHVDDMVDAYLHVLNCSKEQVQGKTYNVGYHNHTVLELGEIVKNEVGNCELNVEPTNDNRSYHVSSEKIAKELGFTPKRNIQDAVKSLLEAFEAGKLPDSLEDKKYFNIKTMKAIELK
ncbi:MAG: UDP-glucose 4-epimerase [Chlamydiales bacterium]|nr:UDP-glucose 4-epimerase [Chlamydiales bacterium]MCH9635063.1 UDP-glucose 4-epimerase [Chlamydiales bacterium]MCH9704201.1 SDR family oxidoreductase [Chlamydiota bacterium]